MKHALLKSLVTQLLATLRAEQRFYKLDDEYAIAVQLIDVFFHLEDSAEYARLSVHRLEKYESGERVEVEWGCIAFESLPARLLGKVAEIKGIVEKWNLGEIDDLPPSTMEDFLKVEAPGRRRLRRS